MGRRRERVARRLEDADLAKMPCGRKEEEEEERCGGVRVILVVVIV